MDRADSVFKNFSVSGFPKGSKPASYVDPADGPAAVHSAQRRIITQQLNRLSAMDAPDGGMTLALPESEVEKILPSLNTEAATIELSDVLNIVARQMRGTEFYANGNPVLNRLALRSRARALIAAMKQEATAVPQQHEATAAAPMAEAAPQPRPSKAAAPRQHQAKAAARPEEAKPAPPPPKAKAAPPPPKAKATPPRAKPAPPPPKAKAAPPPPKAKPAPRQQQAKAASRQKGAGK
jgi:hypothetical protein